MNRVIYLLGTYRTESCSMNVDCILDACPKWISSATSTPPQMRKRGANLPMIPETLLLARVGNGAGVRSWSRLSDFLQDTTASLSIERSIKRCRVEKRRWTASNVRPSSPPCDFNRLVSGLSRSASLLCVRRRRSHHCQGCTCACWGTKC